MTNKFRIICLTAAAIIFSPAIFAQTAEQKLPAKEKSSLPEKQQTVVPPAKTQTPAARSELAEALLFLKKVGSNLLDLKVYQLADTRKSDVEPRIADDLVTSGTEALRLEKITQKVLKFHKLTDICSVVLFKNDNPAVFTYKLRSIALSTGIFNLLSDDEVAALIAHETGHLYFGKELALARTDDDAKLARIVELKSDVVSLITLKNLRIDPAVLATALKKLVTAREKSGLQTVSDQSPALEDRLKLVEIFIKQNSLI